MRKILYTTNFSLWHLNTLTGDGYCSLYDALRNTWFKKFGLASQNKDFWYNSSSYDRMREIMKTDLKHDLLGKIEKYAEENRSLAAERDTLISVNSALVNSRSFRIGRGITYLPRKLRDTFLK